MTRRTYITNRWHTGLSWTFLQFPWAAMRWNANDQFLRWCSMLKPQINLIIDIALWNAVIQCIKWCRKISFVVVAFPCLEIECIKNDIINVWQQTGHIVMNWSIDIWQYSNCQQIVVWANGVFQLAHQLFVWIFMHIGILIEWFASQADCWLCWIPELACKLQRKQISPNCKVKCYTMLNVIKYQWLSGCALVCFA